MSFEKFDAVDRVERQQHDGVAGDVHEAAKIAREHHIRAGRLDRRVGRRAPATREPALDRVGHARAGAPRAGPRLTDAWLNRVLTGEPVSS